ncbi:MAG: DUF5706 domain-containing protein [Saprospiraceae bacterium]|nr:DUF5706 domain-containing protein [Saprospiraceae bacterium]
MNALSIYEKYEQYWAILRNNQEMIRFSEVKAGLVISIFGILFSIILNSVGKIQASVAEWTVVQMGILFVFIVTTLISMLYAFRCFIPRFENKNPTSVIYFGDIVSDFTEYKAYHAFLEKIVIDDAEMSVQLAEQIHTNSTIATRKMKAVNTAMRMMMVSVALLIILVGFLLMT